MKVNPYVCPFSLCVLFSVSLFAQDDNGYKKPPKEIEELVLAKPTPTVAIDKKASWMIMMERSTLPPVE